ncbi:MAG TPA: phage holin family protein, partial [Solirubrobacteraceae bacterium]|nr:phage holin family protein [Solirubrobacteraceae bacterium]
MSARDPSQLDDGARRGRPVARILVVWLSTAVTLVLLSALLSGIQVDSWGAAVVAAAVIGLLNALLWPLIVRVALPLTVATLGLAAIILNGGIVLLASAVDVGLKVNSLAAAIVATIAITLVNTAISSVLAIDDEGFWYRHVLHRYGRRTAPPQDLEAPGLLFLEIDGLAHQVLVRAVRDGNAPTMGRWLRTGSHRLARWETDWSSQTGACQAGILHGNNHDMPAFRWWEKDRGAAIVTNHPRDAAELERRHSDGRGLLFCDGSSRANIVSGDAPHSLLTMSTVLRRDRHGRIGRDYFGYFADPYNVSRTLILALREVASELWSASRQRRLDVYPRVHRGLVYALVRAWATVVQRDLQVNSIIADVYAGRPVVYSTFLAYDEVAHHSGIERPETLSTLRQVDRQIGRIATALRFAPRPYRIVVLSDHGQSQGATFLDRYGSTLEDLVRGAVDARAVSIDEQPSEALAFLGASVTELSAGASRGSKAVKRLSRRRAEDGEVRLGESGSATPSGEQPPEVVVMASGCLGLVSFPREPGRVTLELIQRRYPQLIPRLREHPGVGFLLVRSEQHGAIAIGARGSNYLDEGRVEGEDPLLPFGPNAARHVRRTDGFPHCPDIVINSTYWRDSDEVAAFEELVGSHGGLGGSQSYPFLLHPAELQLPEEELVGAEAVHQHLRRWLIELG